MIDRIIKVHHLADQLLNEYGLKQQGWTFRVSQTKTFLGMCYHKEKVIEFSIYFLEHTEWSEIEDTIRHEIAHALVGSRHGHDYTWKIAAIKVGARPQACALPSVKSAAKHNYIIKCSSCGAVVGRKYRLRREFMQRYKSRCCGAKLEAYHAIYK